MPRNRRKKKKRANAAVQSQDECNVDVELDQKQSNPCEQPDQELTQEEERQEQEKGDSLVASLAAGYENWKYSLMHRSTMPLHGIERSKNVLNVMCRLQKLHATCLPMMNASNGVLREQHAQINRLVRNFPRTVVIGDQCAGKSTLLSHICKEDLFPTGDGTCTFRPTVVTRFPAPSEAEESLVVDCLVHSPAGSMESKKVPFTKLSAGSWVNDKHQSVIEYLKTLHGPTQTLGILLECARRDWTEETDLDLSGDMKNVTRVEMMNKWQDLTINITFQVYNKESSAEEEGFLSFVDLPGLRTATAEKSIMNDVDNEFPFEKLFKTMASHYLQQREGTANIMLVQTAQSWVSDQIDTATQLMSNQAFSGSASFSPQLIRVVTQLDRLETNSEKLRRKLTACWEEHNGSTLSRPYVTGFLHLQDWRHVPTGFDTSKLWLHYFLSQGLRFASDCEESIQKLLGMLPWRTISLPSFEDLDWSHFLNFGCHSLRRICTKSLQSLSRSDLLPSTLDLKFLLEEISTIWQQFQRFFPLVSLPIRIISESRESCCLIDTSNDSILKALKDILKHNAADRIMFCRLKNSSELQDWIHMHVNHVLRSLKNTAQHSLWSENELRPLTWLANGNEEFLSSCDVRNTFAEACSIASGTIAGIRFQNDEQTIQTLKLCSNPIDAILCSSKRGTCNILQQRVPVHAMVQEFQEQYIQKSRLLGQEQDGLFGQIQSLEAHFLDQWEISLKHLRNVIMSHATKQTCEESNLSTCSPKNFDIIVKIYSDVIHKEGIRIIRDRFSRVAEDLMAPHVSQAGYINKLAMKAWFQQHDSESLAKNHSSIKLFNMVEVAITSIVSQDFHETNSHSCSPSPVTSTVSNIKNEIFKCREQIQRINGELNTMFENTKSIDSNHNLSSVQLARKSQYSNISVQLSLPTSSLSKSVKFVDFYIISLEVIENTFMQPSGPNVNLQNIFVGLRAGGFLELFNQSNIYTHTFWVTLDEVKRFMDAFQEQFSTLQSAEFQCLFNGKLNPLEVPSFVVKPYTNALQHIWTNGEGYELLVNHLMKAEQQTKHIVAEHTMLCKHIESVDESRQQRHIPTENGPQKILSHVDTVLQLVEMAKEQAQSMQFQINEPNHKVMDSPISSNHETLKKAVKEHFVFVQKWIHEQQDGELRKIVQEYVDKLQPKSASQVYRLTSQTLCVLEACHSVWQESCLKILNTASLVTQSLSCLLQNEDFLLDGFLQMMRDDICPANKGSNIVQIENLAMQIKSKYIDDISSTQEFQNFKSVTSLKKEVEDLMIDMQFLSKVSSIYTMSQ